MSQTCVKKVFETSKEAGRIREVECGKPAVRTDIHGRNLCQKHYDRWKSKLPPMTGMFNYDTLTVELYKNKIAQAVKVPTFKYTVMENEDAGGGAYYATKVAVEYTANNLYLIILGDEILGWMEPYAATHNIKSAIWPLEPKKTRKEILDFAEQYILSEPSPVTNLSSPGEGVKI